MLKAFMSLGYWLLKGVQIKFILFTFIASLLTLLMALVVPLIDGFISPSALSSSFVSVHPNVWYFINLMNVFSGISLIISAYIARFIIRRLPFIG